MSPKSVATAQLRTGRVSRKWPPELFFDVRHCQCKLGHRDRKGGCGIVIRNRYVRVVAGRTTRSSWRARRAVGTRICGGTTGRREASGPMTTAEQLAAVLGDRAFRKLSHAFGGRVVRVPKMETESRFQHRRQRDAEIMRLLNCRCENDRHHSCRAIARQFGVSPRSVVRIGKRWPLLRP